MPTDGGEPRTIVGGHDFFAAPRISPDGSRLAWLTWDHPHMPWDGTELWVGDLAADGSVSGEPQRGRRPRRVDLPAGVEPGRRAALRDRPDRLVEPLPQRDGADEPLCPREAEFGWPQWVFGASIVRVPRRRPHRVRVHERRACSTWRCSTRPRASCSTSTCRTPRSADPYLSARGVAGSLFVGGGPAIPTAVVHARLRDRAPSRFCARASELAFDPGYLSAPQPIEFPTEGGLTAYALFYPPREPRVRRRRDGERPPLS